MKKFALGLTALLTAAIVLVAGCSDDPAQPAVPYEIQTYTSSSDQFLRNRFFRLDLPQAEAHGRAPGVDFIDPASIRVFQLMPPGQFGPQDLQNVAVYADSTGYGDWNATDMDFTAPHAYGLRWRQLEDIGVLLALDDTLEGISLNAAVPDEVILAVVYAITDNLGHVVAQVGDDPAMVLPTQTLPDEDGLYYRMKLLKAAWFNDHPHVFAYQMRNIYSLHGTNIDVTTLHDLRIEAVTSAADPHLDESGLPYVRIFGLDFVNQTSAAGAEGKVDFHNSLIFDLTRGLLRFPPDFPQPFNAAEDVYINHAAHPDFSFANSPYLAGHLAPELYQAGVPPSSYEQFGHFRIVLETKTPIVD